MDVVDREIERLQDNLQAIRKVAGWTTEDLGNQIGVTKQTISNLENHKTKMTKTQYIALRTVIDYEIATNSENPVLSQVVKVLLNSDEDEEDESKKLNKDNYKQTVEAVRTIVNSTDKDSVKKTGAVAAVGTTLLAMMANPLIIGMTADWMSRIVRKKK